MITLSPWGSRGMLVTKDSKPIGAIWRTGRSWVAARDGANADVILHTRKAAIAWLEGAPTCTQ